MFWKSLYKIISNDIPKRSLHRIGGMARDWSFLFSKPINLHLLSVQSCAAIPDVRNMLSSLFCKSASTTYVGYCFETCGYAKNSPFYGGIYLKYWFIFIIRQGFSCFRFPFLDARPYFPSCSILRFCLFHWGMFNSRGRIRDMGFLPMLK